MNANSPMNFRIIKRGNVGIAFVALAASLITTIANLILRIKQHIRRVEIRAIDPKITANINY